MKLEEAKLFARERRDEDDLAWVLSDIRGRRTIGRLLAVLRQRTPHAAPATWVHIGRQEVAHELCERLERLRGGLVHLCESEYAAEAAIPPAVDVEPDEPRETHFDEDAEWL